MHTIVFRTTNECNLRCKYCYDNSNHDSKISKRIATDNFFNNLDYIVKDAIKLYGNINYGKFIFHGGEPLLVDAKVLNEFCKILSSKLPIEFSVQTNGTLITKDYIDLFKKYKFKVGISLDGANEEQNGARIYKEGGNSFNTVISKMNLLKQEQIKFGVIMSINKLHINREQELYDFIANNEINTNIRPIFPSLSGDNSLVMSTTEYLTFFKNLFEMWYNDSEKRVKTGQILEFANLVRSVVLDNYTNRCCECSPNCFMNFISLDASGEVYACNRLYNINDFYYGNIRNMSIEELENKINRLLELRNKGIEEKCGNCKEYRNCYGGCVAEAYSQFGLIGEKSGFCEIRKELNDYAKKRVLM